MDEQSPCLPGVEKRGPKEDLATPMPSSMTGSKDEYYLKAGFGEQPTRSLLLGVQAGGMKKAKSWDSSMVTSKMDGDSSMSSCGEQSSHSPLHPPAQKTGKIVSFKGERESPGTPLSSSMIGLDPDISSRSLYEELPDSPKLLPAVQRGLQAVRKMIKNDGMVLVDERIKAFAGRDTISSWHLVGSGEYKLRITRESAFTACCRGNVTVLRQGTGEVLWQLSQWCNKRSGVDEHFTIPIDEDCIIQMTTQAHHFCSSLFPIGRSVARVSITHTASLIKGRLRHRSSSSSFLSDSTPRSSGAESFGHSLPSAAQPVCAEEDVPLPRESIGLFCSLLSRSFCKVP